MSEDENADFKPLELKGVIGFSGDVPAGLQVHPDRQHIIYPLGSTIVIEDVNTRKQSFLHGHSNNITCIAVSKSGKYIASGQVTHMGFKADIIVWDYANMNEYSRFTIHKVKVQALSFSPSEKYLVSLGGQDDGSVIVWSISKREAICGSPAQHKSAGVTECLQYCNNTDDVFVTAGDNTVRVWELDVENRKVRPTDVAMGSLKRVVKCIQVSEDDGMFLCGTTTGDVLGININTRLFQYFGPEKNKFSLGVSSLVILKTGEFIIGAGDGTVNVLKQVEKEENKKKTIKFVRTNKSQVLDGAVTSVALRGVGHQFYAATNKCHIYRFNLSEFTHELINTCHYSSVFDVTFPAASSDLFATCAFQDIRVWHTPTEKELLRITIPNMTCCSIDFLKNGSGIISGWDDSKIRGFYPETGRLMFVINDAHKQGVTAIATTSDCRRIISGGGEGQVRVWDFHVSSTTGRPTPAGKPQYTVVTELLEAMKEHANAVSCIRMNKDDTQCVSSSADGTCIVWDLTSFKRKQIIFANTMFRCVCFRPDECQIITSGTDRKVGYWELYDGSLIRELDGSKSGSVNGMDISADGEYFVTGGDDKLLKVWKYNEGEVTHVGIGHTSAISRVRISPDCKNLVSVSTDGAIYIWKFPF